MQPDAAKALIELTFGAAMLNLRGVSEEIALKPTGEAGNSINWILGHVLAYRARLLKLLGTEPPMDATRLDLYYGEGADGWTPERALSLSTLRDSLVAGQERLAAALDGLAVEDLEAMAGASDEPGIPFFHFHEAYHVGQIGLARRCLGLPGAIQPSDASRA